MKKEAEKLPENTGKSDEQIADEVTLLAMPDETSEAEAGASTEQAEKAATDDAGALMVASFAVKGIVKAVEAVYPCLDGIYTQEIQEEGALKLVPLMVKYDLKSEFLAKWEAELEAGMFFGGMIFAGYKMVQMDKAAQAAKVEKEVTDDKSQP
jgi:hypothetical protein